jgi:hypothetical protein
MDVILVAEGTLTLAGAVQYGSVQYSAVRVLCFFSLLETCGTDVA